MRQCCRRFKLLSHNSEPLCSMTQHEVQLGDCPDHRTTQRTTNFDLLVRPADHVQQSSCVVHPAEIAGGKARHLCVPEGKRIRIAILQVGADSQHISHTAIHART